MKDKRKQGCGVTCVTNGKHFESILKASRYAGCNNWTMGLKMDIAGKFVDSLGRIYVRETPMKTKNKYSAKTATVRKRKPKGKTETKVMRFPSFDELCPIESVPAPKAPKTENKECPDFVMQAVAQQIKQLLKDANVWDKICEAMEYCGVKQMVIKKD